MTAAAQSAFTPEHETDPAREPATPCCGSPSNDNDAPTSGSFEWLDRVHTQFWANTWESHWQPALKDDTSHRRRELAAHAIRWLCEHTHGFRWVRVWTTLDLHARRRPDEVDRVAHLRAALAWLAAYPEHPRVGDVLLAAMQIQHDGVLSAEEFDVCAAVTNGARWLEVGPRSITWAKAWRCLLPVLAQRGLLPPDGDLVRFGFGLLSDTDARFWTEVWAGFWRVRAHLDESARARLVPLARAWLDAHRDSSFDRQRGQVIVHLLAKGPVASEVLADARAWLARNAVDSLCAVIASRMARAESPTGRAAPSTAAS